MSNAGTIVVGVDGSSASDQALAWAVAQAQAERRTLTLVHAVPPATPVWLDPAGNTPREARELALLEKGREVLVRARQQVAALEPRVTVRTECRVQDPRETLVELSESARMVVLGSRGRGPVKSLLLGSTAVAVVRQATCPVVVHRPTDPSNDRDGIAVGVDATPDSLPVLELAFAQASLHRLPLTVVHTFWYFQPPPPTPEAGPMGAAGSTEHQVALAETLAGFAERYPDVAVHTEIDRSMPERHLLRLADRVQLLVVGAHHGSRAEQLMFGSVSVWLVEHAGCPVAVVPLSTP